ncbi:MAG TPA: FMN-binding protein [bacterium]|nr:FMN-binding protein [bacterium]
MTRISVSLLFFLMILLGGCAATRPFPTEYKPGEYIGEQGGWPGMTVRVTIREGRIQEVRILRSDGTPSYTEEIGAVLPGRVVRANSPEVDGVSGATLSGDAFLAAVRDALEKAR